MLPTISLCVPCLARRNYSRFLIGFFDSSYSDCCSYCHSVLPWVPVAISGSAVALAVAGVWILSCSRLLLHFGGTDFFVVSSVVDELVIAGRRFCCGGLCLI
jgi:hypothetical protein